MHASGRPAFQGGPASSAYADASCQHQRQEETVQTVIGDGSCLEESHLPLPLALFQGLFEIVEVPLYHIGQSEPEQKEQTQI